MTDNTPNDPDFGSLGDRFFSNVLIEHLKSNPETLAELAAEDPDLFKAIFSNPKLAEALIRNHEIMKEAVKKAIEDPELKSWFVELVDNLRLQELGLEGGMNIFTGEGGMNEQTADVMDEPRRREARMEGVREGREHGMRQGRAQGIQQGRRELWTQQLSFLLKGTIITSGAVLLALAIMVIANVARQSSERKTAEKGGADRNKEPRPLTRDERYKKVYDVVRAISKEVNSNRFDRAKIKKMTINLINKASKHEIEVDLEYIVPMSILADIPLEKYNLKYKHTSVYYLASGQLIKALAEGDKKGALTAIKIYQSSGVKYFSNIKSFNRPTVSEIRNLVSANKFKTALQKIGFRDVAPNTILPQLMDSADHEGIIIALTALGMKTNYKDKYGRHQFNCISQVHYEYLHHTNRDLLENMLKSRDYKLYNGPDGEGPGHWRNGSELFDFLYSGTTEKNLIQTARMLLKYAPDKKHYINIANEGGKTILRSAFYYKKPQFIRFLAEHGADFSKNPRYGKSLKELAKKNHMSELYDEMIKMQEAKGIRKYERDKAGNVVPWSGKQNKAPKKNQPQKLPPSKGPMVDILKEFARANKNMEFLDQASLGKDNIGVFYKTRIDYRGRVMSGLLNSQGQVFTHFISGISQKELFGIIEKSLPKDKASALTKAINNMSKENKVFNYRSLDDLLRKGRVINPSDDAAGLAIGTILGTNGMFLHRIPRKKKEKELEIPPQARLEVSNPATITVANRVDRPTVEMLMKEKPATWVSRAQNNGQGIGLGYS